MNFDTLQLHAGLKNCPATQSRTGAQDGGVYMRRQTLNTRLVRRLLPIICLGIIAILLPKGSCAEMGILDKDIEQIKVNDLARYDFPLDEDYYKALVDANDEAFDPPGIALMRAPLVVVMHQGDANDTQKIHLFRYVVWGKFAYFVTYKFTLNQGTIDEIEMVDGFKAKKMPILKVGTAK